jgi:MATE family multidrug resistance protein
MTDAAREDEPRPIATASSTIPAAPESELRATVLLALPVVLVQIGMMFMGVVDTVMVGHVSARVLAAVALGNLYFFNAIVLANGTLMALDPVIAQAVGAGDMEAVSRAVQRGIILALGLSVVTALLMLPAHGLLVLTRQQPEIIPDTTAYLRISIPGVLPFLVFVVFRQALQALHRVAPIVWTIVGANLCNAGLNWVFVYGHLGSPALGASGSALATLVSRWLMAIALLIFAWPALRPHLVPTRRDARLVTPLLRLLELGVPVGLQQLLESGAFGAIGLMMGMLGTTEMAGHQIAITLAALTFMVPLGVAAAAAVRVGRAVGARDEPRAKLAARAAFVCGMGFMSVTALLFLAVPRLLASIFTSETGVIAIAGVLIPVAGVFQIFDGAQAVGAGVLRGLGDTRAPLIGMIAGYWLIGLPVSLILGFHTSLRAAGLWWGFVASLSIVAVFLAWRIRVLFRREIRRVSVE